MRISSEWSGFERGSRRAAGTNGLVRNKLHCGTEISNSGHCSFQNQPLTSETGQYQKKIVERFGGQHQFEFIIPTPAPAASAGPINDKAAD
jgi:hypothetical protein